MDTVSEQKDALVALGLAAVGFVLLVASTTSADYGLILVQKDRLIWSATRVLPALCWFSIAGILVLIRGTVIWTSAACAFGVSLLAGSVVSSFGAPFGFSFMPMMASISYYALTTALLCLTIRNSVAACFFAPVLLLLQVLTDVLAHLVTGVLQIAC
jgi:hypothetical protein